MILQTDHDDLSELLRTVDSRGWMLIYSRIKHLRETKCADLLRLGSTDTEMRQAQGAVEVIDLILRIPSILESELKR